jgi:hypothetical protein
MLFPAIGMTTAVWLMAAPLTGLEVGGRAELSVAVGAVAFAASLLGVWFRAPRLSLVVLGTILGLANFVLMAPTAGFASMATCAFGLLAAGAAPWPVVVAQAARPATSWLSAPATAPVASPATAPTRDEIPTRRRPFPAAA